MAEGTELEIWWQDEARIGQKNKLTRRWARRGTRPSAPNEQRTQWAYIFGAICPQKGTAAGLVMPYCNTQAMNAHLAEISAQVEPGHHAVLLLDQAGWRTSQALQTPSNITLLPLPAKAPELNPVEALWSHAKYSALANFVPDDLDHLSDTVLNAVDDIYFKPPLLQSFFQAAKLPL